MIGTEIIAKCARCGAPLTTTGPVCESCLQAAKCPHGRNLETLSAIGLTCRQCAQPQDPADRAVYALTAVGVIRTDETPDCDSLKFAIAALETNPTLEQALADLREQFFGFRDPDDARAKSAVLVERERCAKIAESFIDRDQTTGWTAAARIASEIREGK